MVDSLLELHNFFKCLIIKLPFIKAKLPILFYLKKSINFINKLKRLQNIGTGYLEKYEEKKTGREVTVPCRFDLIRR